LSTLSKHAGPCLVAVLYVALALVEGGFDPKPLAIAAVVVWWVIVIGIVVRIWPGSRPPRAAIACGGSLAALGAIAGLSVFWADDAGRAFEDVVRVAAYLGLFVLAVLASRRGSARAWGAGLAAGLGAVAALALLARFEPGLLADGVGDLGRSIPSAAGRLTYPIGYWNGLGAVMALAVVALLWQVVAARVRAGRALAAGAVALPILAIYLSQSLGGALAAAIGVAALLLAARERGPLVAALAPAGLGGAVLIAAAAARDELVNGAAGPALDAQGDQMLLFSLLTVAVIGGAWYLLDQPVRRLGSLRPKVPRSVAVGAAIVALVAAVVALDPVQRWSDFKDPGALAVLPTEANAGEQAAGAASAAGNGRYQWWTEAIDAWIDHPLTGIGAGNYELYWNSHPTLPVVVNDAHSLYLETLGELGPLGLLAVLAFFGTAVAAGIGRRRSSRGEVGVWLAILATGIVSAAGEWTWEIPAATAPVVLAAAMLTGPATLRPRWPRAVLREENDETPAVAERSGFGLGVATLLAGFACIWIAGVSLLSTVQLDDSRAAVDDGDFDEAARNATYASSIEPWSAAARLQVAQVEELRGRLGEARAAADESIDRSPTDWRGWVVLARILARDGDRSGAERAIERANELSPLPIPADLPPPDE
jgi:hypothetical protein